jgi:hypothetical protein
MKKGMTVNLRVDSVVGQTVHCSLFMDEWLNGTLTFRIGEYQIFGAALLMGSKLTKGHLSDTSDDSIFKKWAGENAVKS